MSTYPRYPCRHSGSWFQNLNFKRSVYSSYLFTNGHGCCSSINRGCFQRISKYIFSGFHSSSSSTFLYTYSYHYSAEINTESNEIISGLILYHYLNKILSAIQSYRFLCNKLNEKRYDCSM